jgi:hypothetical protein
MNTRLSMKSLLRILCIPIVCLLSFTALARAEFTEKTVDNAKLATVQIFAFSGDGGAAGSGFVIHKKGYVVTNHHVVDGAEKIAVAYIRGSTVFMKEASLVVSEPGKDLAILKCEPLPNTLPITLMARETKSGQAVMALGFPGILDEMIAVGGDSLRKTGRPDEFTVSLEDAASFEPVAFPGNVGKEMPIDSGFGGSFKAIAHSAKISEGNSGGPLIDRSGRVVGINVAGVGTKSGVDYAFAIHASELIALARANSIPFDVTSSKASSGGDLSTLHILLYIALAAIAALMFLMVLRKPRMVMVDSMSRLVHSRRSTPQAPAAHRPQPAVNAPPHAAHAAPPIPARAPAPAAAKPRGVMHLRGRDLEGTSYHLAFGEDDFRAANGKLVIGRSPDLSQLHLPHDSVSRQHTTLLLSGGMIHVEDRNSGNGTRINGQDLQVGQPAVPLRPGDNLTLGEVELMFDVLN